MIAGTMALIRPSATFSRKREKAMWQAQRGPVYALSRLRERVAEGRVRGLFAFRHSQFTGFTPPFTGNSATESNAVRILAAR
jgi:hypothetical protein